MKVSQQLSERIAGMSFVCAVLVVMMHVGVNPTQGTVQWWFFRLVGVSGLLRVGVPFFFLAAGFFLAAHIGEVGWYKNALTKRVHTLLVPYIIWNLLYWGFCFALIAGCNLLGYKPSTFEAESVKTLNLPHLLGLEPFTLPMMGTTWFIRNLLLLVVMAPIFIFMNGNGRKLMVGGLFMMTMLCFFVAVGNPRFQHFVLYTFSVEGALYFVAGMYLREKPLPLSFGRLGGVISLVLGLCLIAFSGFLECNGINNWSMVMWTIFVPLIMYGIWKVFPLEWIGRHTRSYAFSLYLIHLPVKVVLAGFVGVFGLKELGCESIWFYFVRLIIIVMISLAIAWLLRMSRICRVLLFGGR